MITEFGTLVDTIRTEVQAVQTIVDQLNSGHWMPDVVVGLSRGGLTPAVMLSHALGVPMIPIIWSTRDHVGESDVPAVIAAYQAYENILVVDDITDSSTTLEQVSEAFSYAPDTHTVKYASLYVRHSTPLVPDYAGAIITDDHWVNFSWEIANNVNLGTGGR